MPPITPQLNLAANSTAASSATVTPTSIFGSTPTINFQSPGAGGGSTDASSSTSSILQIGLYALLFIFVVKELNG